MDMTAIKSTPKLGWTVRRRLVVVALAALGWAVGWAGVGDGVVNTGGISGFGRFWAAVFNPELGGEFVRLTIEATAVTLSFAVLGTALTLLIGVIGAVAVSELVAGNGVAWRLSRFVLAVPRSIHEILWAVLLVQVFGFDPLVAVLAIGVPFGAVAAKVFAETIDAADHAPYRALRASGAPALSAFFYGLLPNVRGELVSYSFYRFECSIRSAAVLGVIGAGGLGFQLDLSFETLRYHEIWTLIAALMILSGVADWWSSTVRRTTSRRVSRTSTVVALALIPLSWFWVKLDVSTLWSSRTRRLGADLVSDIFPPRLGPDGWGELIEASIDTVAMSIIAVVFAAGGGLLLGAIAARRTGNVGRSGFAAADLGISPGHGLEFEPEPAQPASSGPKSSVAAGLGRLVVRLVLLLARAVPAPIWAFLMVLILFPGLWPGAVALGIYNLGVLGRLYSEVIEERQAGPTDAVVLVGAGRVQSFFYAVVPTAGPRLISLTLYRWEVIVRETVVVGVVGAGGLGQLINEHLAARDFAAVVGAIGALIVISLSIDVISARLRREFV